MDSCKMRYLFDINVESTIDIFKIIEPTRRLYCQTNCIDLNSWNYIWNSLCLKLCPELVLFTTTSMTEQTTQTFTSTPMIMTTASIATTGASSMTTKLNEGTTMTNQANSTTMRSAS
ncbi:integumentary mucin C1-like [Vespula squamosa]|uniref:Integumentary mucin C1-like n=1 Tax=Vespula squamosa TaxID=30214 RepID=A0ABD1ZVZ9_VESSQ